MPQIFISARRDGDADATQAICEHLVEHYGSDSVVLDVNSLWLGDGQMEYVMEQLSQCDALLIIFGDGWARRLDAAADIVGSEFCLAVKLGIPVIPVLIDQASASMLADLPRDLTWLLHTGPIEVRPNRDYQGNLQRLVQRVSFVFEHAAEISRKWESPQMRQSGDVLINPIGMQLKRIPTVSDVLETPVSDGPAADTEILQNRPRITKPFYLGIYVVTQQQYEDVMRVRPWKGRPLVQEGGDYPATCVSWDDAVDFCHRLSERDGAECQLPTEAQWEYACRAGTATSYSFGNCATELEQHAWYAKNARDAGEWYSHRVGEKLPNPWGLHDMHGNVWEWCKDEYTAGLSGRALRGGSFSDDADHCRSASRHWHFPDRRIGSIGFRVARTRS